MGMSAISIVIASCWPGDQSTINVVGVALLILGCGEGSSGDAAPATWRRSIGARPGQAREIIITELLGVGLPPTLVCTPTTLLGRIIGRLRLIQLGAVADIGESSRGQAHPGIVAGSIGVGAIAQTHRTDLARRPRETTIGQIRGQGGVSSRRGCQSREPSGGGVAWRDRFPRGIGLGEQLSGVIIRALGAIPGPVNGLDVLGLLPTRIVGVGIRTGKVPTAGEALAGELSHPVVAIGGAIVAIGDQCVGWAVGAVAPELAVEAIIAGINGACTCACIDGLGHIAIGIIGCRRGATIRIVLAGCMS